MLPGETAADFIRSYDRLLAQMRKHATRMWPGRDHPLTRASLRDNLRGQRKARARRRAAEAYL